MSSVQQQPEISLVDHDIQTDRFNDSTSDEVIDAHVVILNNYLRRHHVVAYKEIAKRVRKLTVLLSVPMEPDRDWDAEWDGLDVVVQKNKMFTTQWKHSSGFKEDNFIHVPVDTRKQLKALNPDVILSYEMGMRTFLCGIHRMFHRNCRLVMVGNMSQHIESERGWSRKLFRKTIVKMADYFTYNGPSCKRYLASLGIKANRLFHFPYCIDPDAVSTEQRPSVVAEPRQLLYCGAMSSRKGILQFAEAALAWCQKNPTRQIQLNIAGSGDLQQSISELSGDNFAVNFLGNCDQTALRAAYHSADVCVFSTLADEWGLVPIEGMASGLPVLGSYYAQSVESCVAEGENGWVFRPDTIDSIEAAIDRCMRTDSNRLLEMGEAARNSVEYISPTFSAQEASRVISEAVSQIR